MTTTRCDEHLDALPCRGCAADAKAGETPAARALSTQGVPRDRIREILAAAGMPDAPTHPDARTRAAGADQ